MLVVLKDLKPNPMRDFSVDPIDAEKVAELSRSMEEDGFWGGIVCRRVNGHVEIGAGHHRVKAALAAGIETAEVFVSETMDDGAMVRVYARENATQRGNSGTAQCGSVASAVKFLARAVLTGDVSALANSPEQTLEALRGHLTGERGIGRDVVVAFLKGVPGIEQAAKQQLANLKASGVYARIIGEVQAEIEREQKEALKALERAEKEKREAEERERRADEERKAAAARAKAAREEADKKRAELERQRAEAEAKLAEKRRREADAEMEKFAALKKTRDTARQATAKAAEREVTFDFEGVAKHLKNAHQIDVFRDAVTGPGIKPHLPVKNQAALARRVVELADSRGKSELSGAFIRENVTTLLLEAKTAQRQASKEELERLHQQDLIARARHHMDEFARSCHGVITAGRKLADDARGWPKGLPFPVTGEFRKGLKTVKVIIDELDRRLP